MAATHIHDAHSIVDGLRGSRGGPSDGERTLGKPRRPFDAHADDRTTDDCTMSRAARFGLVGAFGLVGLQACSSGANDDTVVSVPISAPSSTGAVDNGVNEGSFPKQQTSGTEP